MRSPRFPVKFHAILVVDANNGHTKDNVPSTAEFSNLHRFHVAFTPLLGLSPFFETRLLSWYEPYTHAYKLSRSLPTICPCFPSHRTLASYSSLNLPLTTPVLEFAIYETFFFLLKNFYRNNVYTIRVCNHISQRYEEKIEWILKWFTDRSRKKQIVIDCRAIESVRRVRVHLRVKFLRIVLDNRTISR